MAGRSTETIDAIDQLLTELTRARQASPHDDLSGGLREEEIGAIATRFLAAIERYSAPGSAYRRDAVKVDGWPGYRVLAYGAVLRALRADIADGYVTTLEGLVHADVFADFLEMAKDLLDKGYKDPAAVLAGSILEEHLRKLAAIVDVADRDDNGRPLKADRLNASLCAAGAYNKLEEKSVTASLDLRNNAAHGHYDQYDHRQVDALVTTVRDFLVRHPA
jgi:hypothetical protein